MILEYMLEKNHHGVMAPSWVADGGYFGDWVANTLVGYTPDLANRNYYVPDTVTVLTKAELVTRALRLHAINPQTKMNPAEGINVHPDIELTSDEVTTLVDTWCSDRGIS